MKTERKFIRGLWGVLDQEDRFLSRRHKMRVDMALTQIDRYPFPYRTYVFGKENYEICKKVYKIKDVVLLSDDPYRYDLHKHIYRHKLDILQYAMEEDKFKEVIYVDWDVRPQMPITELFWSKLGKKEAFQANLQRYQRRKITHRQENVCLVPNGGFLYLRDKSYPQKIINCWNKHPCDTDEIAYAEFLDELHGRYRGTDYYWQYHEAMVCRLGHGSAYDRSQECLKGKIYFVHYQGQRQWLNKLVNQKFIKDVEKDYYRQLNSTNKILEKYK